MTVYQYRKKHPNCKYCLHYIPPFNTCNATEKRISKWRAKVCPCYTPEEWRFEK